MFQRDTRRFDNPECEDDAADTKGSVEIEGGESDMIKQDRCDISNYGVPDPVTAGCDRYTFRTIFVGEYLSAECPDDWTPGDSEE